MPQLAARVVASHGATISDERPIRGCWHLGVMRMVKRNSIRQVSAVEVKEDSMEAGLREGDTLLSDHR